MSHSVLFIDDEVGRSDPETHGYMRYYVQECQKEGFIVHEVATVDEVLETLKVRPEISIAVLDLLMPSGNLLSKRVSNEFETGVELAAVLDKRHPSLPLVILTNARALANTNRLRKLGSVKEIRFKTETTPSELVTLLRTVLRLEGTSSDVSAIYSPAAWKSLLDQKKQKAFSTFLSNSSKLTKPDFFLLSELNHDLMRQLLANTPTDVIDDSTLSAVTLEQLLSRVETESDSILKGKCLEELVARLFGTIPGFTVKTRLRSRTEEIDVFILNGSDIPPWRDLGPAILGECKNWSEKSGAKEYRDFYGKMQTKRGQCKCGMFISWRGFTKAFLEEDIRSSRGDFVMLRLERAHIREAVAGRDFNKILTLLWRESLEN